MHSRRSFLHFGIGVAAALAAPAPVAYSAPAYHGTARSGGRIVALDDAARSFTYRRRNRTWTYYTTDETRFLIAGKPAAWSDLKVGMAVHVRWRRRSDRRVADVVSIRSR